MFAVPEDTFMGRLERLAANKVGLEGWYSAIWEKGPNGSMLITGAVCPPLQRGPQKGQPNWRKRDRSTETKVFLTKSEIESVS